MGNPATHHQLRTRLLYQPQIQRESTADGNAAVAAVAAVNGELANNKPHEYSESVVLLSLFEILRWGDEALPPGTFSVLLRDRRLDITGRDKHQRSVLMVAAKQNQVCF